MSLIEKAARRLEELKRASSDNIVSVPVEASRRAAPLAQSLSGLLSRSGRSLEPAGTPFIEPGPQRRSRNVDIDLPRLAAAGYLTPDTPRSTLADEFRSIKRPLLANAKGRSAAPIRRSNLLMITSSVPGEGKTFTSINLAMSIAMELDSTVLLVDADVARPAVLDRLGLPQSAGLLDVLTAPQTELADVLMKTNVDRLSILPAGTPHPRATELLASEGMNRLLEDLASRYPDRIIVFDAPPVLVSTESRALASQVGQVLLIVEADRTSQSAVKHALSLLENCPVVMTVLNKTERSESGEYYGPYGQYGE